MINRTAIANVIALEGELSKAREVKAGMMIF